MPKTRNSKSATRNSGPLVAVIMGSQSDWDVMRNADETLDQFGVAHECRVISAHRSPALAAEFGSTAESRGLEVVIAAAGGAAHLAGVLAAHTTVPVLGVPMRSESRHGSDASGDSSGYRCHRQAGSRQRRAFGRCDSCQQSPGAPRKAP